MPEETLWVPTPEPPAWVNTPAGKYAWESNLSWRVNAERADADEPGRAQYRAFLLREAEQMYPDLAPDRSDWED